MAPLIMNRRNPTRGSSAAQPMNTTGRKKRRRNRNRADPKKFWGNKDNLPQAVHDVKVPTATQVVLDSLGKPPIPGQEVPSLEYLGAVYERSAGLAFALAAAGGLDKPLPEGVEQELDPVNTLNDDDPYNLIRPEDEVDGNKL